MASWNLGELRRASLSLLLLILISARVVVTVQGAVPSMISLLCPSAYILLLLPL